MLLLPLCVEAQKPALDSKVYDGWKRLVSPQISDDGSWITYSINPQQGDGWLYVFNVASGKKDSVARGENPVFSPESKYLAYRVIPEYSVTRQARKKKLKEAKMPKNDLQVKLLADTQVFKIYRVKSYAVPEKNSYWMAYLLEKKLTDNKNSKETPDTANTGKSLKSGKKSKKDPEGSELVIFNPLNNKEYRYQDVTEYSVSTEGSTIGFVQSISDTSGIENFKVNIFDAAKESDKIVFQGEGSVKKLKNDRNGKLLAFIYSPDTSKIKIYNLWLSKNNEDAAKVVDKSDSAMPEDWSVSENGEISFSENGSRCFFGTAPQPVKEPEDTLLDDEKYHVDIWSWNDDVIQPMQKKQLDREKKRTWMAVYNIKENRMVQLGDSLIPNVRSVNKGNGNLALGSSDINYRRSSSWTGQDSNDYYLINMSTGVRRLVVDDCPSRGYLSPACNYFVYWDETEKAIISVSVTDGTSKNLTSSLKIAFYNELNDMPTAPNPYGIAGWMDDQKHILVYDRYDIWSLDLAGKDQPVNLTNGSGRKNNLTYRYIKLDNKAEYINKNDNMYLSVFNNENKEAGFCSLKPGKPTSPTILLMDEASFPGNTRKAKNADFFIWQKGSFTDYPELYISNIDFKSARKISVTNPQQSEYNWGTTELVDWMSFDHQKLQGILYKPEDFDPSKKYPMIVYFYERSSDGLNNYIPPAPSASIINRTFAVSNGYLVFVPDIPYVTGYPGQSCYDAVMSGTYALLDRFDFIDKSRLGLDGQSWGGYQIAYLVTQTDLFPVPFPEHRLVI